MILCYSVKHQHVDYINIVTLVLHPWLALPTLMLCTHKYTTDAMQATLKARNKRYQEIIVFKLLTLLSVHNLNALAMISHSQIVETTTPPPQLKPCGRMGMCIIIIPLQLRSALWHCWLCGRKSIWPVMWCWHGYLSGAKCNLHMVQLMPLSPHHLLLH